MRFSVIMPAYNAETTVLESIKSVLNQEFGDYELIVVDDGSSDNTSCVVDTIMDKRIKLKKIENRGVSAARNEGISESRGDYVCFLDSDDYWFPNHLKVLNELIDMAPDAMVLTTGYQIRDFNGNVSKVNSEISKYKAGNSFVLDDYIGYTKKYSQFIHINSLCAKREHIDLVGWFEVGEKIGEDTDFIYRLTAYSKLAVSPLITSEYRRNSTSTTATRKFNFTWSFLRHGKELLCDSSISEGKKKSIRWVLATHRISGVRNRLLQGERDKAFNELKKVDLKSAGKKHLVLTLLMFFVPRSILSMIVEYRDRGMYE